MNFIGISTLVGSIVLIAFAIQLFTYSAGNLLLNKLLAVFFLNRGISNLLFFAIALNAESYLKLLYPVSAMLLFLSPATIFLYTRSFISDSSKLKFKDWLHIIPALLVLVNLMPSLWDLDSVKTDQIIASIRSNGFYSDIRVLLIPLRMQLLLRSIMQLVYLVFTWKIAIKFLVKKEGQTFTASQFHLATLVGWFTLIEITAISISAGLIFMNHSMGVTLTSSGVLLGSFLILSGIIIWFLRHPVILYGNLKLEPIIVNEDIKEIEFNRDSSIGSISSNKPCELSVEPKIAKQIAAIEKLMKDKKPFLDPEFNLEALAESMNMPLHHCSYFLNQVLKKSFKEYLNSYRIDYFIELYTEKSDKYTIDVLASEVGYRHRSTFNIAFKNNTGKTPTEYFNLQ